MSICREAYLAIEESWGDREGKKATTESHAHNLSCELFWGECTGYVCCNYGGKLVRN